MTLDNLLVISLERVDPDSTLIKRLLVAAQRNVRDAELTGLSNENRFDAAYKAIMQMANAALQSGVEPDARRLGEKSAGDSG